MPKRSRQKSRSRRVGQSVSKKRGSPPSAGSACELVLCEDPGTGEWVVRPKGNCPLGYIEKAAAAVEKQHQLIFKFPKVRVEEESEDNNECGCAAPAYKRSSR